MRISTFALVASCLVASPAVAGQAANAPKGSEAPNAQETARNVTQQRAASLREVWVCDTDSMTRRAFAREFGKTEYVSAEAAVARGESWTTPKCVTPQEARRLQKLANAR